MRSHVLQKLEMYLRLGVTKTIIDTPAHWGGCIFLYYRRTKMQIQIKDYSNDDLTYAIDNVTKVVAEYNRHLAELFIELEARQDKNRPVQLELF